MHLNRSVVKMRPPL